MFFFEFNCFNLNIEMFFFFIYVGYNMICVSVFMLCLIFLDFFLIIYIKEVQLVKYLLLLISLYMLGIVIFFIYGKFILCVWKFDVSLCYNELID